MIGIAIDTDIQYIENLILKTKYEKDEDALKSILKLFAPLRRKYVRRYEGNMIEGWDIEQEINIAIYKACLEYDSKYGYPVVYIKNRVGQEMSKYLYFLNNQGWLDTPPSSGLDIEEYEDYLGFNGFDGDSAENDFFNVYDYGYITEDLTDKQKQVVFFLSNKYTQEEVAGFMGISRQAVGKHLNLARKKIEAKKEADSHA